MPLAIVHFKSRKQVPVLHPWTITEWQAWIQTKIRSQATMIASDEKGNQFVICVYEVEFVMVPLVEEENDGK